jgi:hypothetical protein
MKRTSTGYKAKKSRVFLKEDVGKQIPDVEAPDENFLHIHNRLFNANFEKKFTPDTRYYTPLATSLLHSKSTYFYYFISFVIYVFTYNLFILIVTTT